jgi:predicted nucleic acid-binding protein
MCKSYVIDTCIWRDFYEDRVSKSGRPLGKYATGLFMKILKEKSKIFFSESLIWELHKDYPKQEINDILNILFLGKVLVKIEIKKEEHLEAKKLSQEREIPYVDCLNAIHARNYNGVAGCAFY